MISVAGPVFAVGTDDNKSGLRRRLIETINIT